MVLRQIVLASFGDDHHPNTEELDDFEEGLQFGESMIIEVPDEPDDDDDDDDDDDGSSFAVPAFPPSSSVLFIDLTSSLVDDDNEGVSEDLSRSGRPPPPQRRKLSQPQKKTLTTPPAAQVLFQCADCPYKTTGMSCLNDHQQVHEDGSEATACNQCGIFVIPSSVGFHRRMCAPAIRKCLGNDKKLSAGTKGTKRNVKASDPNYIYFKRGVVKKVQYGCRHCPYETLHLARIQVHVELHEEGSNAVSCGECGWFLPPEQLETHRAVNHSTEELPGDLPACEMHIHQESNLIPQPSSGVKKLFKCPHCPHECKTIQQYEGHQAVHEDSTAIPCPDCDIFYRPGFFKKPHVCGKWKLLKRLRLKKARLNQ